METGVPDHAQKGSVLFRRTQARLCGECDLKSCRVWKGFVVSAGAAREEKFRLRRAENVSHALSHDKAFFRLTAGGAFDWRVARGVPVKPRVPGREGVQ